jgi:glutaminyl-peptide cyclotransferase
MSIFPFIIKISKATRISVAVLATVLLIASCRVGVNQAREFDAQEAYALVEKQMEWIPRSPGSEGHEEVRRWIEDQLAGLGWQVETQCFDHLGFELCNLIGWPRGWDGSKPYLMMGAHYDTRWFADSDPLQPELPVPGANDGASGVAVLLELARVIGPDESGFGIALAFFDGEDQGHLLGWDWSVGSRYMVDHLERLPEVVVVVDMVGDSDLQIYIEGNSDPELAEEIWSVANEAGFAGFVPQPKHAIIDDHLPFAQRSIPAVDIIDIEYPMWHTTKDDLQQISADSLYQVGRTLQLWLEKR